LGATRTGAPCQAVPMSASTPADLAVTFRSLARRQREAMGDADPSAFAGPLAELQGHVATAAAAMHTADTPDAVAQAIDSRPADEWDDATLEVLRAEALAAGAVLRHIAAQAEEDDD
jgi:hypothetical protein